MANMKKKKEEKPEVVANCDNPKEVDANCDHLENGELTLSQHDIEKLIMSCTEIGWLKKALNVKF